MELSRNGREQTCRQLAIQRNDASLLAAIVLLIGGIIDAYMLYFYAWYRSSIVMVFALGFLAYCLGLWIERRRSS